MRAFDLSPLLRATVGFDRIVDLLERPGRLEEGQGYPPYNIEKTGEDSYRITMAVAGFAPEDLNVTLQEGSLLIEGKRAGESEARHYLHHGIAARTFQRSFRLADFIKVTGAALENGLLHIELAREVPEAMKPRRIAIKSPAPSVEPRLGIAA